MFEPKCPRCGSTIFDQRCTGCGATGQDLLPTHGGNGRIAIVVGIVGCLFLLSLLSSIFLRMKIRDWQGAMFRESMNKFLKHGGPVARMDELKGQGRIYLMQMGPQETAYSVNDAAKWLREKYALDVRILPEMQLNPSALDTSRALTMRVWHPQYIAQLLLSQMKREHPDLAADPHAYMIGYTDKDMYSVEDDSTSMWTLRDEKRAAVISTYQLGPSPGLQQTFMPETEHLFESRMRRILLKDVAVLYWHLPVNLDNTSVLRYPQYLNTSAEEIYESDIHPTTSRNAQFEGRPCFNLVYSPKDGIKPLAGTEIKSCSETKSMTFDDSQELFQVDLQLGLLLVKHVDFDLPDTLPIRFQRTTRDGWNGPSTFGMSGTDSFDPFLSSKDNVTITINRDDYFDELIRTPKWLSVIEWVKYVDTRSGRYEEMKYFPGPSDHYDLRRYDGTVETFYSCLRPHTTCYKYGERDANGQEITFTRDAERHLTDLKSPHGKWLHLSNGPNGRIEEITDSTGRVVRYGYNERNQLVSVTYPSGQRFLYTYDDTQHLLTFSVAASADEKPRLLMSNKYVEGKLVEQTLSDGSVYKYGYQPIKNVRVKRAFVGMPDGRYLGMHISNDGDSAIHEMPEPHWNDGVVPNNTTAQK